MSSSIRIKVRLDETTQNRYRTDQTSSLKFVYVIDSPTHKTIDELIQILQKYINQQFLNNNTQIVKLTTGDGFILSKSDLCSVVLTDNDYIICIDMKAFAQETISTIDFDNLWLELKQHDVSDNEEKTIQIGLNKLSKLFIRMFANSNFFGIYIFSIFELMAIASEKRRENTIARFDSTNDYEQTSSAEWFLDAKWEYGTTSNKDLFIICNLKTGSSDEAVSNKLHIRLDDSRMHIEKGEIIRLSGEINDGTALTDRQRQRLKELTSKIPSPKRTGPQINLKINENLKLTRHECEGESSIRMAYGNTNTVTVYQGIRLNEDGTMPQHFVITHIVFSEKSLILQQKRSTSGDKPVSVTDLTVLYQAHNESWRECYDVAIAPIAFRNEEPQWLIDSVINIEQDRLISFVIKGWIPVKGEAGRDNAARSRVHKNLPQPLKLKIVTTDNFGKQCSLVVEQLNTPLELPTHESYVKNNQSSINEFLAFVYTDDCENDVRIYMVMYLDQENGLRIENSIGSSCAYERKAFSTMEYNARKNKTSEVPLDDTHRKYYTNETIATALFDPETYMLYAIRLEISTKTSKTEETVLIPIEKIKQ